MGKLQANLSMCTPDTEKARPVVAVVKVSLRFQSNPIFGRGSEIRVGDIKVLLSNTLSKEQRDKGLTGLSFLIQLQRREVSLILVKVLKQPERGNDPQEIGL